MNSRRFESFVVFWLNNARLFKYRAKLSDIEYISEDRFRVSSRFQGVTDVLPVFKKTPYRAKRREFLTSIIEVVKFEFILYVDNGKWLIKSDYFSNNEKGYSMACAVNDEKIIWSDVKEDEFIVIKAIILQS